MNGFMRTSQDRRKLSARRAEDKMTEVHRIFDTKKTHFVLTTGPGYQKYREG